jgi:hypothetical protein
MSEALYKSAAGAAGPQPGGPQPGATDGGASGGAGEDDVVDAEFEVKK